MADRLRLSLDKSHPVDEGALLIEKRSALGLSIDAVADRLLLSRSQVRGLESNSAAAFYSQRFFERARDKYGGAPWFFSRRARSPAAVPVANMRENQVRPMLTTSPLRASTSMITVSKSPGG